MRLTTKRGPCDFSPSLTRRCIRAGVMCSLPFAFFRFQVCRRPPAPRSWPLTCRRGLAARSQAHSVSRNTCGSRSNALAGRRNGKAGLAGLTIITPAVSLACLVQEPLTCLSSHRCSDRSSWSGFTAASTQTSSPSPPGSRGGVQCITAGVGMLSPSRRLGPRSYWTWGPSRRHRPRMYLARA